MLLDTLDLIYGPGGYVRISDDFDQHWEIISNNFSARAISSFAFGVINFGLCQICNGADDILFTPSINVDGQQLDIPLAPSSAVADGLYTLFIDSEITTPGFEDAVGRVFSTPMFNANMLDHMVTFRVLGQPNTYIIAFEDVLSSGNAVQDRDFNDLALEVTSLYPVPEPGSITLMLSGLLAVAGLARRRSRRLEPR